jgi:hypothetical protein
VKSLDNGYFAEKGENINFRHQGSGEFSVNKGGYSKMEASYRKVDAYSKGLVQYRRERGRRRKVRFLVEKGLSQRQIAVELGVCVRTVKRDWSKIRSYVKGQQNKTLLKKATDEMASDTFRQWSEGLSLSERSKILGKLLKPRKPRKQSKIEDRELIVYLNMDNLAPNGFPRVTTFPAETYFGFSGMFNVRIRMIKDGERLELLGFRIGR